MEAERSRRLSAARWDFTGWWQHYTGGRGREFGEGGGERGRARTCLLVVGGVCVRARDSVCYNIRVSLSWVLLQVLVLRQALDVGLLKDLLHHLVLVSSNKPGQAARQQHPDQL